MRAAPFKGVQVPQQVFDFHGSCGSACQRTKAAPELSRMSKPHPENRPATQDRHAWAASDLNAVRRPWMAPASTPWRRQLGNLQGFGALPTDQARGFRCQTFMQQVVQGGSAAAGDFFPAASWQVDVLISASWALLASVARYWPPGCAFFNGAIQIKQGFAQRASRAASHLDRADSARPVEDRSATHPAPDARAGSRASATAGLRRQTGCPSFGQKLGDALRIALGLQTAPGALISSSRGLAINSPLQRSGAGHHGFQPAGRHPVA